MYTNIVITHSLSCHSMLVRVLQPYEQMHTISLQSHHESLAVSNISSSDWVERFLGSISIFILHHCTTPLTVYSKTYHLGRWGGGGRRERREGGGEEGRRKDREKRENSESCIERIIWYDARMCMHIKCKMPYSGYYLRGANFRGFHS